MLCSFKTPGHGLRLTETWVSNEKFKFWNVTVCFSSVVENSLLEVFPGKPLKVRDSVPSVLFVIV